MRKKNTTLILLIAILVSLAACTTPKQPKYYINATLKDFFNYKPGSYWVFYDSVSNIFDSLYVKQKLDYLPYATSTTDGNEYIHIYNWRLGV